MKTWLAIVLFALAIPVYADGLPVELPSASPSVTALSGLSSAVGAIPGANWIGVMFLAGILDLIMRWKKTNAPRDLLRMFATALHLLATGAEKLAALGDAVIGQNLKSDPPETPKQP